MSRLTGFYLFADLTCNFECAETVNAPHLGFPTGMIPSVVTQFYENTPVFSKPPKLAHRLPLCDRRVQDDRVLSSWDWLRSANPEFSDPLIMPERSDSPARLAQSYVAICSGLISPLKRSL
jgi:hypothetical protein